MELEHYIRDVPDFPKPGIVFKDITPLLADPAALAGSVRLMGEKIADLDFDHIVGIESRGFLFGVPLALQLNKGFTPIRKPNKLPYKTRAVDYDLEYGSDRLEIHEDGVHPGSRVILVDDLLATGGTMAAACTLVENLGARVSACLFLVELGFLSGREKLPGQRLEVLVAYP
ncbi:MAG: adenine phosphoribosyltransferase [Planctomycetota bacterium]|jgi:adenine phosphoribosyltransferase